MEKHKNITNYMNDGFIIKNPDGEDEIIHIPYNLNNVLVNESDIIQILNQYNVNIDKINHIEYFRQAFTHKSYCRKDIYPSNILSDAKNELGNPKDLLELMDKSYERLEYFGDRVLKLIVSMYLFHRYPKQDEGFMTRLQTKIEDKKNLSIMSKEIGLSKFFIISKQIELMNGRNLEKIHEDVFESFIGALFLSNGFEPCMFLIINLLETLIDYSEKLYCDNNYKDQLLRIHHQNKWKFPQYVTIHYEGPPHKRKYIMGVERHDAEPDCPMEKRCVSFGIGSSKKEGEQNAAKMALIIHGILKQDQYSQSDIYYPPWDKIAAFDGETMIIKVDETNEPSEFVIDEDKPELITEDIIKSNTSSETIEPIIEKTVQVDKKSSKKDTGDKTNSQNKSKTQITPQPTIIEDSDDESSSESEIEVKKPKTKITKESVKEETKEKDKKKKSTKEPETKPKSDTKTKAKTKAKETTSEKNKKKEKKSKIENLEFGSDSDDGNYSDKSVNDD